jgi:hypothetical protein
VETSTTVGEGGKVGPQSGLVVGGLTVEGLRFVVDEAMGDVGGEMASGGSVCCARCPAGSQHELKVGHVVDMW